jgi:hypothetical protein
MVEFTTWEKLTREDRQDPLDKEKGIQLEPEHIEMGVSPRPKAEHVKDDYMAQGL